MRQPPDYGVELEDIKRDLIRAGHDLSGPNCGKITREFAWRKRGEGFGLLKKETGNNFMGASTDYLTYRQPDGSYILSDVIGDGGGSNHIQWDFFHSPDDSEENRFLAVTINPNLLNTDSGPVILPPIDPKGQLQAQIDMLKVGMDQLRIQINELHNRSLEVVHDGDKIALQSKSGDGHEQFMRYDWDDKLAKFDAREAGSGETYQVWKK